MNSDRVRTGGCQCGRIRYRLNAAPRMLYVCHCRDCQSQSSSAFGMSLIANAGDIEFVQGEDQLRYWDTHGDNGHIKRCYFCPNCGSRILHAGAESDARVSIKAGSLDDTRDLRPVAHIWLQSAQPWLDIDRETLLCFEREPDDEAELARLWQAQNPDNDETFDGD